ncbi:MAG: 4-hydroxy-tetrahydrodipicolinate reductase [Gallicola sp.]|nr:4-hydroxy-tetrahydrodipicolinate reductase [Gallicola sp.]
MEKIKIILSGATGKMGETIGKLVSDLEDMEVIRGFADEEILDGKFPIYTELDKGERGDVLIDFSTPKILDEILEYCKNENTPLVIGTTGYSEGEIQKIHDASKSIPIMFTGNMSVGVNVMEYAVEALAAMLEGFDIEIIEKHHKYKVDSPSGTAKMLFEAANRGRSNNLQSLEGRAGHYDFRDEKEVGISSIRGGNIVGEHSVIFAGTDEIIEIKHTANSKAIFANGALKAAKFLEGQKPGLYNMNDVLGMEYE